MRKSTISRTTRVAAWLGVTMGIAIIAHGVQTFTALAPPPVPYRIAALTVGLLLVLLSVGMLRWRDRASWSFYIALNGTMAVVGLFGAAKIRDVFELPFAIALLPAIVFALACALATLTSDDFR